MEKTKRGESSPAKPALMVLVPTSITMVGIAVRQNREKGKLSARDHGVYNRINHDDGYVDRRERERERERERARERKRVRMRECVCV